MAEDTIHRVQQSLGVAQTDSQTRNHVLYGGQGFTDDYWEKLRGKYRMISEETAHHLTSKFGIAADKILALTSENAALAQPIVAGYPAIQAEVVYTARHEMATTIDDVLARRIGVQLYSWRDAIQAAPVVGLLMAKELRWSTSFRRLAITHYVEKINHLLDSAGLSRKRSSASTSSERAVTER
jgi:glycerol-3-phosphate dehydrogenase